MTSLAKLPAAEKRRLEFSVRQFVDAIAPTNFPATNPDVLNRALETDGASVLAGLHNFAGDIGKGRITMSDESAFALGRNLAITPGSVVFRNALIEVIQYDATTSRVARRPLLIVPPCINKYYILDLRPENSFVRHAVAQGHTVFIISWRNIPPELGHLTWGDYLEQGVLAALSVARSVAKSRAVNALGFCVGGTLLASMLAVLAARQDESVASATFLTTMLDFADPGEIACTSPAVPRRANALMAASGFAAASSRAFASLRPNDLVWNSVVNNYLKGRTPPPFDLLYWNGDSANLPGPMYSYYLQSMYVDNKLREHDALTMLGAPIDLARIKLPAYVFASRDDHIVPWGSAYRTLPCSAGRRRSCSVRRATSRVLSTAGRRQAQLLDQRRARRERRRLIARATSHAGSWWPHWYRRLNGHAGGQRRAADLRQHQIPAARAGAGSLRRRSGRLSLHARTGDVARATRRGSSRPC
jgi:polyhydroxyalkanoate synthase